MVSNNLFLSLGPQNFISDIILSHTVQTTGTKISYGTSTIRLVLQKFKKRFCRFRGLKLEHSGNSLASKRPLERLTRYETRTRQSLSDILRLAEDSIAFECRYSKSLSLSEGYTIEESENATNRGDLSYSLSVTADLLGKNTEMSITRNHNVNQIIPK